MNTENNKQFVYRVLNRKLVDIYCKLKHRAKLVEHPVMISVVMLSFNRVEDTIFSIKALYKNTKIPFELILFDNNSNTEQVAILNDFVRKYKNIKLIESEENLGCAKGRVEAVKYAKGEYLLFLDNDIVVTPYYLENLLNTINMEEKTVAVSCKVIFPDLTIQFNGGTLEKDNDFYRFNLLDSFKLFWDSTTTHNYEICPWIPGGATLWKTKYYKNFPIDEDMRGSFEDNEVSVRITDAGFYLRNCPKAIAIHYHMNFKDLKFRSREKRYIDGRYNNERTVAALRNFWKVHKKVFIFDTEEATYGFLPDYSKESILNFLKKPAHEN